MGIGMKKTAIALVASGALLVASVGSSMAGVISTSAGVTAGPFNVTTPGTATLSGVELDGATNKVATGTLGTATVKDASGAGQGWKVQVSGGLFANSNGKTLPADALSVTGVAATKVAGKEPTNSVSYANGATVSVPLGSQVNPVTIYNAGQGTGMGTFELAPTVALTVPADAYAGTYSSNLTMTLAASP